MRILRDASLGLAIRSLDSLAGTSSWSLHLFNDARNSSSHVLAALLSDCNVGLVNEQLGPDLLPLGDDDGFAEFTSSELEWWWRIHGKFSNPLIIVLPDVVYEVLALDHFHAKLSIRPSASSLRGIK